MPRYTEAPITSCSLSPARKAAIDSFAERLREIAPTIAPTGLAERDFWDSGLFQGAIERLRGQNAATMAQKREFIAEILCHLQQSKSIRGWSTTGGADRHDYEITMDDGSVTVVEAKGCLDGNNTVIYQRPPNADQFVLWSLCQNSGADPRHNV